MKQNFLNDNIKSLLGIAVILAVIGYFFIAAFTIAKTDPQTTITFNSILMLVLGYYFGSSSGSSKKDDTLNSIAQQPTVTQTGDKPQVTVNPDEK